MHKNNIVHRDIKPTNVMLTKDHDPVIIDFGLSESRNPGSGTKCYLAPEHKKLIAPIKLEEAKRMDCYALGATLMDLHSNY